MGNKIMTAEQWITTNIPNWDIQDFFKLTEQYAAYVVNTKATELSDIKIEECENIADTLYYAIIWCTGNNNSSELRKYDAINQYQTHYKKNKL